MGVEEGNDGVCGNCVSYYCFLFDNGSHYGGSGKGNFREGPSDVFTITNFIFLCKSKA